MLYALSEELVAGVAFVLGLDALVPKGFRDGVSNLGKFHCRRLQTTEATDTVFLVSKYDFRTRSNKPFTDHVVMRIVESDNFISGCHQSLRSLYFTSTSFTRAIALGRSPLIWSPGMRTERMPSAASFSVMAASFAFCL